VVIVVRQRCRYADAVNRMNGAMSLIGTKQTSGRVRYFGATGWMLSKKSVFSIELPLMRHI